MLLNCLSLIVKFHKMNVLKVHTQKNKIWTRSILYEENFNNNKFIYFSFKNYVTEFATILGHHLQRI